MIEILEVSTGEIEIIEIGVVGPAGTNGADGLQGTQGIQGVQGIQGPPGISQFNPLLLGSLLHWWDFDNLTNADPAIWQDSGPNHRHVRESSGVTISVSPTEAVFAGSGAFTSVASPIGLWNVPDGSGETPGNGFTCTGLAYNRQTGTLFFGNDGRARGGSTFLASVVETSLAGAKLNEYILHPVIPGLQSIQGVAFNPADNGTSIWIASTSDEKLYRINLLPTPTVAQTLTPAGIDANGLAFDETAGTLWVCSGSTGNLWEVDLTGAVLRNVSLPFVPDHLTWRGDILYLTSGTNGVDGQIFCFDTVRNLNLGLLTVLSESLSTEGLAFVGTRMYAPNDAYFHNTAVEKNAVLIYDACLAQHAPEINVFFVARANQLAGTQTIVSFCGEAAATQGLGVFVTATGQPRIILNSSTGTTQRDVYTITQNLVRHRAVYCYHLNSVTGAFTVFKNGIQIGSASLTPLAQFNFLGRVRIGSDESARALFGGIATVLVAGAMTSTERMQVSDFLFQKYM